MPHKGTEAVEQALNFAGTDLEIRASFANACLTISVLKSGSCVHRVILDHATDPIEHAWLAELFARDDRVPIGELAHEVVDYWGRLNTNQG